MARLLIVGKSQSGKSTALHRLTRAALSAPWSHTLIADGKGVELPLAYFGRAVLALYFLTF